MEIRAGKKKKEKLLEELPHIDTSFFFFVREILINSEKA